MKFFFLSSKTRAWSYSRTNFAGKLIKIHKIDDAPGGFGIASAPAAMAIPKKR
jgi:hypothetical protein